MTTAQLISAQIQQVGTSTSQPMTTLVKTVSTPGSTVPSVTIPLSAVSLGLTVPHQPKNTVTTKTLTQHQMRQIQLQQLQQQQQQQKRAQLAQQQKCKSLCMILLMIAVCIDSGIIQGNNGLCLFQWEAS